MDIALLNLNGIEATRQIRDREPSVKVVALLCYDRQGVYLNNVKMNALVMRGTPNGDLLIVVDHWSNKTVFFQKVNPKNGQIKYSVGLSTREFDLTVHNQVWLPYHSTLNRAYYVGAMEYMIKEIDVTTRKILR